MSRAYRSIGEVLSLLADEHPDLTISKIRFLESQGLIDPQRTPSGYRKFFEADIERLNWVLIQQRDHFLPLKEIKRRLASGAVARAAPRAGSEAIAATPSLFTTRQRAGAGDDADSGAAAETAPDGSVSLTVAGLARAVGIDAEHIAELQRLGIIVPAAEQSDGDGETDDDADPLFDHDALMTARTAAALADHGIPARNLRMFKVAADREAGIYEQLLGPLIARGETDRLQTELTEIVELTEQLRRLLLQRTLRTHLD
ncbi:MAG: MerR family transcriptional regulator [Acidimicrobiaceae bacterium]|nr:MerR family transcriptional regulator [Acidimicrobiaceae bacterium]MYE09013.1 MerR family transcriptional regulator [Acidimicrobiaceae bacterium]